MMKILITRPRSQAGEFAEKLRAAGFDPVHFPVIEIQPLENNVALERALSKLNCYEWVVFTSANAVNVVFDVIARRVLSPTKPSPTDAWRPLRGASSASRSDTVLKVAAIGPKTAEALKARGVEPDFVPDEYVAEAILPGLGDLRGKWVLLPRAEGARKALPDAIAEAGGIAHEISVYKTLPAQPEPAGLAALRTGVDVITFTSPSTVQNFVAIAKQHGLDPHDLPNRPLLACIGPITGKAAREEGLTNLIVSKEYTTEGLVEAIRNLSTDRRSYGTL